MFHVCRDIDVALSQTPKDIGLLAKEISLLPDEVNKTFHVLNRLKSNAKGNIGSIHFSKYKYLANLFFIEFVFVV